MTPTTEARWMALGNVTAMHAMITGHRGLVLSMARQFTNGGGEEQFKELVAEGDLALCESLETYKVRTLSVRFSTHAHQSIRRAMISFLRTDGVVKTEWQSRRYKNAQKLYTELADEMEGRGMGLPTTEEFAFVHGRDAEQALNPFTYVNVDDVYQSPELSTAPEDESIDYNRLPMTTRVVIDAMSHGSTLGELAGEWGCSRDSLNDKLGEATRLLL